MGRGNVKTKDRRTKNIKNKRQKNKEAKKQKEKKTADREQKQQRKQQRKQKRVGVMTIETKKEGAKLIVELKGRLDTTTAPELEELLKKEIEGVTDLQMDFAGLEYISSAGLRVMLYASKTMKGRDGSFVIRNACKDVMDVFVITGFADKMTIES